MSNPELLFDCCFGCSDDICGFLNVSPPIRTRERSLMLVISVLAARQLGSKRQPELQDKSVICQVLFYTEGEDSLRRIIDSLAALNYDDRRKLIFIFCDGNVIGSGNERTTPRIVLDILGVGPQLDPDRCCSILLGKDRRR